MCVGSDQKKDLPLMFLTGSCSRGLLASLIKRPANDAENEDTKTGTQQNTTCWFGYRRGVSYIIELETFRVNRRSGGNYT